MAKSTTDYIVIDWESLARNASIGAITRAVEILVNDVASGSSPRRRRSGRGGGRVKIRDPKILQEIRKSVTSTDKALRYAEILQAAKDFGCSVTTVYRIVNRRGCYKNL